MPSPVDAGDGENPCVLHARPVADWCDMALVTQANLVALRVQQSRRAHVASDQHDVRTPAPGAVRRLREHLLERDELAAMTDQDLALRCRQVWGEFAAFCWLFRSTDPHAPPRFAELRPADARGPHEIAERLDAARRALWRTRFEQQLRWAVGFRLRPDFQQLKQTASHIEVDVFGQPVHVAPPQHVVLYACETAGVIAALRWAMDDRLTWEQGGVSDVGLE